MNVRPALRTLTLALALELGAAAQAQAQPNSITLLSLNCYAFPAKTQKALKAITGFMDSVTFGRIGTKDLASGVETPIPVRIDKIALAIRDLRPDVVCLQEIWKRDNKDQMIKALAKDYPYTYFNPNLASSNVAMMDDGLLVASRFPFQFTRSFTYEDFAGDEKMAKKGADIVAIRTARGPILFVDTHMQAGTEREDLQVKEKQATQLARELVDIKTSGNSSLRAFRDAPVVIAGDFNEPITFINMPGAKPRVVDRTRWLVATFNAGGIPVDNKARRARLMATYQAADAAEIYELKRQIVLKTAAGDNKIADREDLKLLGQFNGDWSGWAYWTESSDPKGYQILDHVFIDERKLNLTGYQTLRREFLGETDPERQRFSPANALSDHAAIITTINWN